MTNQDGKFSFVDLKMDESYFVKPALDVDPLEGVSTKDIVMIQNTFWEFRNYQVRIS